MLEVEQAPAGPGIYAWYANMLIGELDWKMDIAGGADQAVGRFLSSLQQFADIYEPLSINVRGSSAYGAAWDGELVPEYAPRRLSAVVHDQAEADGDTNGEKGGLGSLRRVAFSETDRGLLAEVLASAVPYFASPLYIGMATNLRERLLQHRKDFTTMKDLLASHPEETERARAKASRFGHRAAARGIAMERLEVRTVSVEMPEGHTGDSPVPAAAEWLLHRFFMPPLGRR